MTVTNQGLAAGRPGMLQVWAKDSVSQGCAAFGDKWVTLESLAAGASTTVKFDGLPAGPAGPKTLQAFVDSACETEDINDINIRNQSTQAYTVVEYADSELPSRGSWRHALPQ
ncbi:hypothetical protein [uncultured Lamprocystis sp.]|uniref:hypothetical protein n=2 Tax=uncultured Lamprocystis sp. TaxID=543132 RepID=UPI0025EE0661|nr:hypothetical protein [uncultured Lamprocystis sp.]